MVSFMVLKLENYRTRTCYTSARIYTLESFGFGPDVAFTILAGLFFIL